MLLLKQSGIYLAARIVPALVGLAAVAFYTRLLDPASIGAYALLLSTSLLCSGVGFTWIRIAALRIAAGDGNQLAPDFSATIGISFLATTGAVALIEGIGLHVFQPQLSWVLLLLTITAAVAAGWYDLNASLLQARVNVLGWGALNLGRALAAFAGTVVLIRLGWKTEALLGGFVLGNGATLSFAKLWFPARRGRFDSLLFWRCFHFGWPQSVNAAQGYFAPAFQRWVLQLVAGSTALGIFAVSQDFSLQTMASLVGSISLAGIPLAFRAKEREDAAALAAQLRRNARLIFGVALPASVGFIVLAKPIVHTFFGAPFWDRAPALLVLFGLAGLAVNLRTYYFDQAFELTMETRPQPIITLFGTIVTVVATIVLVPRYSAIGAGVAALAASISCLLLSVVWGLRVQHMPVPLTDWTRTGVATAVMAVVLVVLPGEGSASGLLVALCCGGLTYLLISTLTRMSLVRAHFGERFVWLQR